MRWDLIETFDVIKKGRVSRARKSFQGTEDFFAENFPGAPCVPEPLFVEMIAQAGGVLFGVDLDFKKEVVLAKIQGAKFFKSVSPPCTLNIEATLDEVREDGAWISGVVTQGNERVAETKIMLVAVDTLVEGQSGKIVFNDHFLKQYRIQEIVKKSEALV